MDLHLTLCHRLRVLFTVLCLTQLVFSQDVDICSNTWISYPNANVPGGSLSSNVNLVTKCQSRCLAVANCSGIDFDGANRCWLIRNFGLPKDDTTNRTTHYDMKAITSCTASCNGTKAMSWRQTNNSHVLQGQAVDVQTFGDCLKACRDDDLCASFDWDATSTTIKCWSIKNDNTNYLDAAPGVRNFKKECFFGGVRLVTPAFIPPGEQAGSQPATGLGTTTIAGGGGKNQGSVKDTAVGDYVSGDVFTIKPAYIVLLGMGLACILLVVIAVIILCCYPLKGGRRISNFSVTRRRKGSKKKKLRQESGELHTRRPKALAEDDNIGMQTGKTSLQDSTFDHKMYNEKNRISSMYDDDTKKIRDTYDDMKQRDSFPDAKTPYHYNHNGTLDKSPLPAYTAHHDSPIENITHQRHSLDMDDIPGNRNSGMNLMDHGKSNYDKVDDEIHDAMDNPAFHKAEEYD